MVTIYSSYDKDVAKDQHKSCGIPTPDCFDSCPPVQCEPEPCCRVKTRARDAITIKSTETERCFSLSSDICGVDELAAHEHKIRLDILKKGHCKVLFSITPTKATLDGNVCFTWPRKFYALDAGYYEADLFIDCNTCSTILLYKPTCAQKIETESVSYSTDTCKAEPCGAGTCAIGCDCCGDTPQVDVEYDKPLTNQCEDCNAECS